MLMTKGVLIPVKATEWLGTPKAKVVSRLCHLTDSNLAGFSGYVWSLESPCVNRSMGGVDSKGADVFRLQKCEVIHSGK